MCIFTCDILKCTITLNISVNHTKKKMTYIMYNNYCLTLTFPSLTSLCYFLDEILYILKLSV